jgi:hypothetical protein
MISKSDFIDWKKHPVTKEVFSSIIERIHQLQEELGSSAGLDVRQDSMKVGAIQQARDILEMNIDDMEGSV